MEAFTHLSVLVSIILGLGIAELLTRVGGIIEHRERSSFYFPSLSWALVLLIGHVQTWWTVFGLRDYPRWTFLGLLAVLLQPLTLFLLAALSLPRPAAAPDLRANYFSHRNWFFSLLAFFVFASLVKELVLFGSLPSPLNLAFHAVLFVVSLCGIASKSEGMHQALAYVTPAVIAAYIALLFAQLS